MWTTYSPGGSACPVRMRSDVSSYRRDVTVFLRAFSLPVTPSPNQRDTRVAPVGMPARAVFATPRSTSVVARAAPMRTVISPLVIGSIPTRHNAPIAIPLRRHSRLTLELAGYDVHENAPPGSQEHAVLREDRTVLGTIGLLLVPRGTRATTCQIRSAAEHRSAPTARDRQRADVPANPTENPPRMR